MVLEICFLFERQWLPAKFPFNFFHSIVFLLLFSNSFVLEAKLINSHVANLNASCFEEEKKALLKFKALQILRGMFSSWVGQNCWKWVGISCGNQTGNVIKLSLSNISSTQTCLSGELDHSLLNLTYLHHLDLSHNSFNGTPIPSFIGSLNKLRYLDLSHSIFGGMSLVILVIYQTCSTLTPHNNVISIEAMGFRFELAW